MGRSPQPPTAVLDVGSNTIRLLVGRVSDGVVEHLVDQSEFVRLGMGVDTTGELQPDRVEAGVRAVQQLAEVAREAGAKSVRALATSAVRDARNRAEFVDRVQRETGVRIEVISGDREAELTFRGATLGVDLAAGVMVCDLGGGSAELLSADADGIRWSTSEPFGAGRLTERFIHHDPPETEELRALEGYVDGVLDSLPSAIPRTAVLTGGTATHLALMLGVDEEMHAFVPDDVRRAAGIVADSTAADIVRAYDFRLERAQVLAAGITAIQTIVSHYGVASVIVTRQGIREGALLESV